MNKRKDIAFVILTIVMFCNSFALDLSTGGYGESITTLYVQDLDSSNFTENLNIRLEGALKTKVAGLEMSLALEKNTAPLSPSYMYKTNSTMIGLWNQLESQLVGALSSTVEIPDGFDYSIIDALPYSTLLPLGVTLGIDRLLVRTYLGNADLTIGVQQISWGTGYAFNPTDLWNVKNPNDAEAPAEGVNAVRCELLLGQNSSLDIIAAPQKDIQHSSGGIRFKTTAGRFEGSLSLARHWSVNRDLCAVPKKIIAGFDLAGEIFLDIGVWNEIALYNSVYPWMKHTDTDSIDIKIDAGLDYTFTNGLYLMGEYFYSSEGCDDRDEYSLIHLLKTVAGDAPGVATHYFFTGCKYTFSTRYEACLFSLVNATDWSSMIVPSFVWNISDNFVLELKGAFTTGIKTAEFGSMKNTLALGVTGYY